MSLSLKLYNWVIIWINPLSRLIHITFMRGLLHWNYGCRKLYVDTHLCHNRLPAEMPLCQIIVLYDFGGTPLLSCFLFFCPCVNIFYDEYIYLAIGLQIKLFSIKLNQYAFEDFFGSGFYPENGALMEVMFSLGFHISGVKRALGRSLRELFFISLSMFGNIYFNTNICGF